MDSLYAKYIKERENFSIIEDEYGFATYNIAGDECYIRDIYVLPEHRKSNVASCYADRISEIAREQGCKYLTGTVAPSANGSTTSIKVLLGYGFRLLESQIDKIIFVKEL